MHAIFQNTPGKCERKNSHHRHLQRGKSPYARKHCTPDVLDVEKLGRLKAEMKKIRLFLCKKMGNADVSKALIRMVVENQ